MYTIISNSKAIELINNYDGRKIKTIIEYHAMVYKLSDSKYLIIPEIGESSLLFENEVSYFEFIKNPQFPFSNNNILFRYVKELREFDKSFFYKNLSIILKQNIDEIKNNTDLERLFLLVNKEIGEISKEIKDDIFISSIIVIGDYLCKKYNFKWAIDEENYQFQTYFRPKIVKNNIDFYNFYPTLEGFIKNDNFNLSEFNKVIEHFIETLKLNGYK